MQISSSYNLPVTTGYARQDSSRQPQLAPKQAIADAKQAVAASPQAQVIGQQQKVRPTIQVQPLFDQSLTYRGEQARRAYQNVEMGGEVELMQRLDEKV